MGRMRRREKGSMYINTTEGREMLGIMSVVLTFSNVFFATIWACEWKKIRATLRHVGGISVCEGRCTR